MDKVISTIRDSGLLDPEWYLSEYPDVVVLNMDPVDHYVQLGASLYRDPGPNFSTRAYLLDNPDVLRAGINPLYHFLIWGENEGRESRRAGQRFPISDEKSPIPTFDSLKFESLTAKSAEPDNLISLPDWHLPRQNLISKGQLLTPFSVMDLEVKLWGGYSSYALPILEKMKYISSTSIIEKINIGWHLARWYFVEGQFDVALKNILFSKYYCIRFHRRLSVPLMKLAVVESQCLARMGKMTRARKALVNISSRIPDSPNLNLAWAAVSGEKDFFDENSLSERDAPLAWINKLFEDRGLATLQKRDENAPLSFFNFTAQEVAPLPRSDTPEKISIIIPAYGAEETIHIPITSLLKQTWSNLEIIVVDDCSPDGTANVVEELARQDERVRLIRKEVNGGAYPARNLGLKYVTGDYIMVHDSDDWSHPQKLEIQMAGLKAADNPVAVISHWVRFNQYLRPVGAWRPTGSFFDLNFSSLMFKREVLQAMGGWDEVRVSGDAEFRARIVRKYGKDALVKISQGYLLSVSLMRDDSLTQTKVTHLRSLDFGLRWLYRDAYQYWHGSDRFRDNSALESGSARPFPVPKILRSRVNQGGSFDFLIVTDLAAGAWVPELLSYIQASREHGWSTALYHWPRYESYVHAPIDPRVYEACQQYDLEIITNGDEITVRSALVPHPEIFQYRLDQFPQMDVEQVAVVATEALIPNDDVDGSGSFSSATTRGAKINVVKSHLLQLFGTSGTWWPISVSVHSKLADVDPSINISPDIWLPLVDLNDRKLDVALSRRKRNVPNLGRYYGASPEIGGSWPDSFKDVKRAYCVDSNMKVHFVGDEDVVCSHFGRRPNNWTFKREADVGIPEFLTEIDFYIYYPDRNYFGIFDPVIPHALYWGIPVVTYPALREVFRNAAIYSTPEKVASTIAEYWADKNRYADISQRSRKFALDYCDTRSLISRFMQ
ncbi:glycosyltransferase family 2 protein [Bordetella genomosp. 4]|uniref:Glycosyltransferase 2-like domain-containing protein n=1 Tax=Bordetella genomosp. 4 TaxID=463044 RepID=A0A261U6A9_9BORD|nr:glycosyltransferase family A protein [Bordetella genomosp. 4]OZI56393.1 hypothetical protein CAL20_13235 [Bordetella genomosp. 4]